MPRFLITRPLPGAGKFNADERRLLSAKTNEVIADLSPDAQWVTSYIVDHKIYCVYNAKDAETIHEHARRSGLPVDAVELVLAEMNPNTGRP